MKIKDAIVKYDSEFRELIKEDNKVIANSMMREDLLQSTYLHAIKTWQDQEIDENTLYNWVRQKIINSILYQYKKIDGKIIYLDNIQAHIKDDEKEE